MDVLAVGSLSMYTKNLRLKTQWDLKRGSGNVTGHETLSGLLNQTPQAAAFQKQADEAKEQGSDRMRTIMNKVSTGKKLTEDEKRYLQSKDPKTYTMIQAAEEEQKSYEREIKRCRTKEEVQRVRTAHLSTSLARIKSVENNPNIPQEEKNKLFAVESYRCEKLNATTRAFVKRGDYAKLPTELEESKARKEEKEAKEAREGKEAEETKKEETKETEEMDDTDDTERETKAKMKGVQEKDSARSAKEGASRVESPEARKVRRAKARSAWGGGFGGYETEGDSFSPSVEARA